MGWLDDLIDGTAHNELMDKVYEAIRASPFYPPERGESGSSSGASAVGGGGGGLSDIAAEQINDILASSKNVGPQSLSESLAAFSSAIAWADDQWIFLLIAFHAVLFILTIVTRNSFESQRNILFLVLPLILLAQTLNDKTSENWKMFSTQDYFDSGGIFTGVFWAAPLLLIGFIAVANLVRIAGNLLVEVKTKTLKDKRKKTKGSNKSSKKDQ